MKIDVIFSTIIIKRKKNENSTQLLSITVMSARALFLTLAVLGIGVSLRLTS